MFDRVTPSTLLHAQLTRLDAVLPFVLDGRPAGIHDARIATRRIRELLPLVGDGRPSVSASELARRFRRLGRSLGRVRDADVQIVLLSTLEQRIPHAAPTLVVVRQQRERERLELMRKVIKRLERLEAIALVRSLRAARSRWAVLHAPGHWRRELAYIVAGRSDAARRAIEHATGVYFPKRTHAARIAIKKLRYALEIVHEIGPSDRSAEALRDLKKTQDVLGDLHDRQELIDGLSSTAGHGLSQNDDGQVALIRQVVEAEAHQLHARYLERRQRLVAICDDAVATRWPPRAALPAVPALPARVVALGAIALSSGAFLVARNGLAIRSRS
jgi:CHAD domain-containing protein